MIFMHQVLKSVDSAALIAISSKSGAYKSTADYFDSVSLI